ncbi:hypothetical protein HK405_013915, partial [Cladochytrium tenue]
MAPGTTDAGASSTAPASAWRASAAASAGRHAGATGADSGGGLGAVPDFNQLFEMSRQLTSHIVTPGTMPQLERGLDQIDLQTRKLSARSSRIGGADSYGAGGSSMAVDPPLRGGGLLSSSFATAAGGGPSGPQSASAALGVTPAPTAAPGQMDARTAYLLANRGFDADKVNTTLSMIDAAAAGSSAASGGISSASVAAATSTSAGDGVGEGLYDTDVDGHLQAEHQNIVVAAIEESRRLT